MRLKDIACFLNKKIPETFALPHDNIGFAGEYDANQEVGSIKIYMDLLPEDDTYSTGTLVITHHPPLFAPKTSTYTIHSNWDIVDGGANDALAKKLKLDVVDIFDRQTNIGRICKTNFTFRQLKEIVSDNFENVRTVNKLNDNMQLNKIGVISGFGLKNPDYIRLAKEKELDLLISGDLTHETAILAKNLKIPLIDLGHHESEIPGLYQLSELLEELDINVEVIDKRPIEQI